MFLFQPQIVITFKGETQACTYSGTRQEWPYHHYYLTLHQMLANAITQEKKIRDGKFKEEIKLLLYAEHIITYLENPRKSIETLLHTKIQ